MSPVDSARHARRLAATYTLALLLMVVWTAAAAAGQGTVRVSNLNVRNAPEMGGHVLFRLSRGSQVRVLQRTDGWLKIDHQGRQGFIVDNPRFVSVDAAGPSGDGDNSRTQLKELYREADTLQERLKRSQTLLNEISGKEKSVLEELDQVERALDDTRRQVRVARMEYAALAEKVSASEKRHAELENQIQGSEDYMSRRLVALYKLGWLGRIQLLATASSFYDFITRKVALERILAEDEALLEKLRRDHAALASLLEQLNAGMAEKKAARIALDQRAEQLLAEQARRNRLLDTVRSRKELEYAALQAIKSAAAELDGVIAGLKAEPLPRSAAAPASTPKHLFEQSKGLLQWPVKGKVISFFGPYRDEKTNLQNFQSGIDIKAERGEPVRAVAGGHAIYAGWFKGLGNMIIIDHGNHYYTVYAHLEALFKAKGDRVAQDEVIATVGDSGSLRGPALRFEVRHRGKPVDPMLWINKG